MRQREYPGGRRPGRPHGPNESGLAHPGTPPWTGGGDRRGAHENGAALTGRHGTRGAPRIPLAARAPTVDHRGVHPSTGVAVLHLGGARRHVAPGTGGRPHRHRGGKRPGPPPLASRPVFPLAQAPGRPPRGARGRGVQPRGNPPAAPQQEGAPLPAEGHGPGRSARLREAMGRRGSATAAGPLDPPDVVLTHGHPGPCRPSRQGDVPTATTPRRGPAPQPAGKSSLDTVEGGGQAPEPVFPPGAGPGATPRRGRVDRGVGGDRARHGLQVDHCGRPATHAIATGVPPPPTGGPLLGPPPRPHKWSVEGHAEPR